MQKKNYPQNKKKISLAVPETCHQASSLFSIPDIKLYSYRIKPTYQCNTEPGDNPILYAPSFLFLWALHYVVKNPHPFSSLLCHRSQCYSPLAFMWLKLRLKNERRLMGSDVSSPMINKNLRQHIAITNYSALSIGTWLQLMKNHHNYYENLSIPIFWLDSHKNNIDIHKIISKLQYGT
ncbi:hypothetical protein [Bartonella sp. A05]|uniref:hypothetical protein n=1 Tax=Bartonella sp. A05 TaxID=2967261 RepID=UPI0022A9805B|nr:hypothetical protein [Bartonella sp. A05]MCZ2204072.1 hypothetical protein [Bartonella sp. A05]